MERGGGREEVHGGDALCLGQWYRVELVSAKGWRRIPATPPYVSSYLFLLPVYDAPSSVERREKIGEEERRGKRTERREMRGERWFVNIHYVCAEKGEVVGEKWKRNETVGTHAWKTCATHGTQEFTATRARVKRTRTKKETEKKCAAEPM